MIALSELAPFAETIEDDGDYLSMGFSLAKFKLVPEKEEKALKSYKHAFFDEKNKNGDPALLQLSGDENMFNELFSLLTSREQTFSLRALIKKYYGEDDPLLESMTTRQLSEGFQSIPEEFGEEEKPIDVWMSPSQALVEKGLPGVKMSGAYVDKYGNWRVELNLALKIVVPRNNKLTLAREVFVSLDFRFKMTSNQIDNSKKFSVTPKNIEITNLKVHKKGIEDEEDQMIL